VRDAKAETRIYTRLNGEPAVGILIVRQSGANTIQTARAVQEKLEQAKRLYPNLNFRLAYDQSRFIGASVHRVQEDALIGATLAVIILLFFLRNVRSTLVVALSIPISIVSTFALIYLCGFSLNTMSLAGMALAVGLIVDDAVVVLENIFRHIERDKMRAAEAAVSGTQEILTAVVASTLTIMIVFLPLLLIQGQAGQMFTQLALVVIFAIGVSLLDAATVVPMLASRFIKAEDYADAEGGHGATERQKGVLGRFFRWSGKRFDALDESYRRGLQWSLRRRWLVVGGAFGVCALSLLLVPFIGVEMMPQTDSGDLQVNVKMPIGTSFAKTNEVMLQVEKILQENPHVATVFAAAGTNLSLRGVSSAATANQGAAIVKLKDDRKASTQEVIADLRRKMGQIPGIRPRLNQIDLVTQILTGGNQNVEVNIFGENLEELGRLGGQVMEKGRDVTGWNNVDVNWQDATPELQWKVDRQKALQLGLSFADIASVIGTATRGQHRLLLPGERLPVPDPGPAPRARRRPSTISSPCP
jgi:HAE1 family hydrophobic/amphiphilic exporter-1